MIEKSLSLANYSTMCYSNYVKKLKAKVFAKWATKERVSDQELLNAIQNIAEHKSADALGSSVYKVRIPRRGEGKSGGYRTLLIYREGILAVFLHGFAKNDQGNISSVEKREYRKLAKMLCGFSPEQWAEAISNKIFIELEDKDE